MNQKVRRPKVNVPSYVKISAMLSPSRSGKINRSYIKSMCLAIDSFNRHKNSAMKKINRESSNED